jgi:hypothetical protein
MPAVCGDMMGSEPSGSSCFQFTASFFAQFFLSSHSRKKHLETRWKCTQQVSTLKCVHFPKFLHCSLKNAKKVSNTHWASPKESPLLIRPAQRVPTRFRMHFPNPNECQYTSVPIKQVVGGEAVEFFLSHQRFFS